MMGFLAAAAQFPVSRPSSWGEFSTSLTHWVEAAVDRGAKLLVFPEYASLSLTALFPESVQRDLAAQLTELQALHVPYQLLFRDLAQRHGVYILAGSFPLRVGSQYVNRAWLCGPCGELGFQDKQVVTRFEREKWFISRGQPLKVFNTALGCIGIAICYDSEFPVLVRSQLDAGAQILLVPSCTDALPGYHRVRIAAQARALEGQCFVVMSPLVGEAEWSPAVDVNVGAAGIYGPPDIGFPEDGLVAQGTINKPDWIYGEIDLEKVSAVRAKGQVLNYQHWTESISDCRREEFRA